MAGETPGILYLCATPIGNLEDITLRVLRVLGEVDLIAAEDTRRTRKLLSYYDIHNQVTSYNEHNHDQKSKYILDMLENQKNVALVSDAGMPGISDPGEKLVSEAVSRRINVVPLPGPSAAVTAVVVSGLPAGSFVYEGFLPSTRKTKRKRLSALAGETRTMVFYESPFRLKETLSEMHSYFGSRRIAVARELTKKFEEVLRGTIEEMREYFEDNTPRGEFALVVEGARGNEERKPGEYKTNPAEHVAQLEAQGLKRKEAIKKVARLRNVSRQEIYMEVVKNKKNF